MSGRRDTRSGDERQLELEFGTEPRMRVRPLSPRKTGDVELGAAVSKSGFWWSFLLKLDPDRPSPTIQAQPGPNVGPFHWENRRLRVPELRRLFTFPDDFAFVGKRSSVQSQLGNAVPPLLARRVAEAVGSRLLAVDRPVGRASVGLSSRGGVE